METRGISRYITGNIKREITYNGLDRYLMEFLKELRDLKDAYYPTGNINWIGRYLSEEAKIWWRLVHHTVTNINEFEEKFIEKFWSPVVQETIRDKLEYGQYKYNGKLSMTQYMERNILLCHRLMPPISKKHHIKKLTRHYTREVEIAVITRGIKNINEFELLLHEYSSIRLNPTITRESHNTSSRRQHNSTTIIRQMLRKT